ncbi:MAG TPA: dihydropteroate synthase [Candidatus Omnitrophica bacterium]|nr:MAG: dihydropteroate synthase [Omnitrophica WOR_2 bacterium GWA2_45_18]HBR15508.1 dihydropteroate synthase [Candidatus Omnitrophota bacterium]
MRRLIKRPTRKKDNLFFRRPYHLRAGSYDLVVGSQTRIMGIVNTTPDSFSGDGCCVLPRNTKEAQARAVALARKLIKEGADMIDIGGESTRPGARKISAQEEIRRVIPTVQRLAQRVKVPISVDTYKAAVARHALDAGASIINNIMGVKAEKSLLKMIRNYGAAVILMHIQGTPRTMQKEFSYQNLMAEICLSLRNAIENCLDIGIKSDKIVIDPGIGFGKNVENNLEILHRLRELVTLNQPVLIGTSRKSFIGKILNKDIGHRLTGTVATVCAGIFNGAHIVRVHDVKAVKEAVTMTDAILNFTHLHPVADETSAVKDNP